MKRLLFAIGTVLGFALTCLGTTHYVDANGSNPTPPYLDWTTAATNIQDAVDAAVAGDLVMVTNGVYAYGGRPVNGYALTNRVAIDIAVTVQSVNGASVTTILGNPVIGDNAVRCVYMTNGATLIGFTLANGATRDSSGVAPYEQDGGGIFCESSNIPVSDCVLATNSAESDGGAVYQGTLNNCTLVGNTALSYGGGADGSSLTNCLLTENQSEYGGGGANSLLNACLVESNSTTQYGGGADNSTLNNCLVAANTAEVFGGGVNQCNLNNCTVVSNSAPDGGGGVCNAGGGTAQETLNNCIVFNNSSFVNPNYSASGLPNITLNYCCTTPLPSGGTGNITNAPLFVGNGNFQLQSNSPCVNAGDNAYVVGTTDVAGNPRIVGGVVDIGAYEYQTPVPLTVAIQAADTNVATGIALPLEAVISRGAPTSIIWDFGDGTSVTNESAVSHAWSAPGLYTVTVTVSNAYTPGSATASVAIETFSNPVSYVNPNSINPVAPYSSWNTAATNIQNAIDATSGGGLVLVTNGVYAVGGRTVSGSASTNRVVIDQPVTVQSVNGPTVTTIQGGGLVRCVFLSSNSTLIGFTIAGGSTLTAATNVNDLSGGGIWCASINNCVVSNCNVISNWANAVDPGLGGGVYQGTLLGCTLSNNTAATGGGSYGSVLSNCVVTGNLVSSTGGGAYLGALFNCIVSGNTAGGVFEGESFNGSGGGIASATVSNCLVIGNSANTGGGIDGGTIFNSIISSNTAALYKYGGDGDGGGVYSGTIFNCAIFGNTAVNAGGAYGVKAVNCTIVGNVATSTATAAGGIYGSSATNCIVYFNTSSTPNSVNYVLGSILYNCCTFPKPPGGTGNITNNPALASLSQISLNSPCRGAGLAAATTGVDIDGNPWANPPSIGCDEPYPGTLTNTPAVGIIATYTNIPVGYPDSFIANISGAVDNSVWDFGDGTRATNAPFVSHTWTTVGYYPVTLYAFNDAYPAGLPIVSTIHVYVPTNLYVSLSNASPVAPYDSWAKAATNIQNAIDVAYTNGVILVSNGVYNVGGRTNTDDSVSRVLVWQPLTIQSVNGSAVTRIDGGGNMRCVYLTNGAGLVGFTITNGSSITGGGILSSSSNNLVANCLVISNSAGLFQATATNCTFVLNRENAASQSVLENCVVGPGNSSPLPSSTVLNSLIISNYGGIAQHSTLVSCTLTNNAIAGLGIYYCNLTNCLLARNFLISDNTELLVHSTMVNCTIVTNQVAITAPGGVWFDHFENCIDYYNFTNIFDSTSSYSNCCMYPFPLGVGIANFTNPPLFVNIAGGDYHLQSTSPCINAGNNLFISATTDLDSNPRIQGGTVDVGAYEYQSPASLISYAWLQQYGLPTDGSVDSTDLDGTGFNVYQDWIAGLNPTNALSVLAMLPPAFTNSAGVSISWQSVSNETYYLERATDLGASPAFTPLQSNIVGQTGITTFLDITATNSNTYFYRVGIQQPYANISN